MEQKPPCDQPGCLEERHPRPAPPWWAHLRRSIGRLTAGGRWTDPLAPSVRRNLRWFWLDGVFAQASESIAVAYLSLFVLALGASRAQIGLMSALSSLSAAALLMPAAAAVERWGQRKRFCLLTGGGVARLTLLLLALLPLAFSGPAAVAVAIGLAIVRTAFANMGVPAWTSLTADIVPLAWRGRYFASRNIAMGLVGMAVVYAVGVLITRVGNAAGYPLAMGLAFVFGAASSLSFAQLDDPAPQPQAKSDKTNSSRPAIAAKGFLYLCAITALWNLSLGVAGPFFSVYLVDGLHASAAFVGGISVVNGLAALPGQRLFGVLSDRWGPRKVQLLTGLIIPLVPWGWALARSSWQLVPIEIISGFVWAGYGLSSFNFLLTQMPEEQRARYSALYQIVVMATYAAGSALGGLVATHWGYTANFALSGAGRLTAALLFATLVR